MSADIINKITGWEKRSGLDNLSQVLGGQLDMPDPMADLLNINMVSVEKGECVYEGIALGKHLNPRGIIHGGWAMSVLDTASVLAIYSGLPKGKLCATADFQIKLLKPVLQGMRCQAIGNLLEMDLNYAKANARLIEHKTGRVLALANCKAKIFAHEE